jgi:hypothetical protein
VCAFINLLCVWWGCAFMNLLCVCCSLQCRYYEGEIGCKSLMNVHTALRMYARTYSRVVLSYVISFYLMHAHTHVPSSHMSSRFTLCTHTLTCRSSLLASFFYLVLFISQRYIGACVETRHRLHFSSRSTLCTLFACTYSRAVLFTHVLSFISFNSFHFAGMHWCMC